MAGLGISILLAVAVHREAVRKDWERFGEQVRRLRGALDTRVEKYQLALEHLRDSLSHDPEITKGEWLLRLDALSLRDDYSSYLRLGLWRAKPVTPWPAETEPPLPLDRWLTNKILHMTVRKIEFNFELALHWVASRQVIRPPDEIIPNKLARIAIHTGEPRITPPRVICLNLNGEPTRGV